MHLFIIYVYDYDLFCKGKIQAIKSNFLLNNEIMEDTKCITFYSIVDKNADGEKIRIVQKLSDYILKFYLKQL